MKIFFGTFNDELTIYKLHIKILYAYYIYNYYIKNKN